MSLQLPTRLISFVGLNLQVVSTCVLALLFILLARSFGTRAHVRLWTRAWIAYGVALSAVLARYLIGGDVLQDDLTWNESGLTAHVFYTTYLVGKIAFAALLVYGAWRFGHPALSRRVEWWLVFVVGGLAAVVGPLADSLSTLVIGATPILAACYGAAAWLLQRAPPERASIGTSFTSRVLWAASVLAVIHGLSFVTPPLPFLVTPQLVSTLSVYGTLSTYIDLLLEFFLAVGMVVIVLQDISSEAIAARHEEERLRSELARGEKLRALGTLVSGLAHELNNPLTAILGYADTARLEKLPRSTHHALDVILEQAERCRAIVFKLLGMSGGRTEARRRVGVADLLLRVQRGLAPQARNAQVGIRLEQPDAEVELHVDATAVEQALTNLLGNAVDASNAGDDVIVRSHRHGASVVITILDRGAGIAADAFPRLFEPFFSTKPLGRGTGLGLSLALGVIESHGGSISARNRAGGGACFEVRLPAALPELLPALRGGDLRATGADANPAPLPALPRGNARRVLLVEDEESVRHLIRDVLSNVGWLVHEAGDGLEAEQLLFAAGAPLQVEAVITDLRMPQRGGVALVHAMARLRPELVARTLLIGGDFSTPSVVALLAQTPCAVLEKPFAPRVLLERLETLVSEAESVA